MTSVTSTQKNTDFEPQNVLFRATDFFYIFTAQSMLKFVHYWSMV